jgi:hypothetical protein
VSGLVVEQLRSSGGISPDDALALSARLGLRTLAAASGRALVWGPAEVHPLHPERSDWTSTDALLAVKAAGVSPAEVLLVRTRLDQGSAEGRQEVAPVHGGLARGTSAEWTYRARVELVHPTTGRTVVESTAEARVDPFRSDEPGLGPLLDRVLDDALAGLESSWALPLRPALETWRLLAPDGDGTGLDGEVRRLARVRLANPGLGEEEAARLLRRAPGVLIRTAELTSRLHAGDIVTTLDGAPVQLEALERARLRGVDARLEVQATNGTTRRLRWP